MKKVFAFLSTLLLTIAMVGVVAAGSHVKAASDKITVDPTLAEDEIPVYIMDSIYSTFPNQTLTGLVLLECTLGMKLV